MAFDAHAADFGLVLADYFQNALDQKHPSLRHFKLGPVYFLDDQDPVFLALLDKLRDLLSSEPPLGRGREHQDLVRSYFSPFRRRRKPLSPAFPNDRSRRW
jgi:hypothetical protein